MVEETPQFEHDSACCTFLGRWCGKHHADDAQEQDFDLYHCMETPTYATVLARRSSEPSDYLSGLVFRNISLPIAEAARRAEARGLSTERGI